MASIDIKNIVKSVQRFDGLSNVDTFCSRLSTAITTFKLKPDWVILNFHLFIDGEVINWWKWAQTSRLTELTSENAKDRLDAVLVDLKEYYEPESVKKEAKKAMKSLRFVDCISAGEYVSKKLAYFSLIDPGMTSEKQVQKLIKGLPESLRNIMYGCEPKSHTEFLQRLRRMDRLKQKPDPKSPFPKPQQRKVQEGTANSSGVARTTDSENGRGQSASRKGFDNEGNRLCHYCKKPGHIIRDCPTRPPKTDERKSSSQVFDLEAEDQDQSKN